MSSILLLSSDALLCKIFKSRAKELQVNVIFSSGLEQGKDMIKEQLCDAIVVSIPLHHEPCPKKILQSIQEIDPYLPVFFLIDRLELSQAISLTKLGAENCYSKPFFPELIVEDIQKVIKKMRRENRHSKTTTDNKPKYLKGCSEASRHLYEQIDQVRDTNFKVIIYGETGSGKESVAKRLSDGIFKDKPFVAVDCGCLSKELAASELFGHKKGSFTGAFEDKVGAFEAANNGTLFLDEIGNLEYSVQILLLRAIEENKIKRIGSNEEIDVNVRVIVASNEKLIEIVKKGTFREDLYYRLNEFEITIPPLRNRMEDLKLFVNFFIEEANHDLNKNITGIQSSLYEKFCDYDWKGNIRELKNVIRRGCLLATNKITNACMSDDFLNSLLYHKNEHDFDERYVHEIALTGEDLKHKSAYAEYLEIIKVLKEENFNRSKTAKRLNINRKTLYNKLKTFEKLGVEFA